MIIVHLADLHFGYRAYSRTTPDGVNRREADVSIAVGHAFDRAAELQPDLVVIAGDLFHSVRPSNSAIADAFRKVASLVDRLPGVPVVIVAGDRDTPRASDATTILELFREIPGVFVATREIERFRIASIDTEVVGVPHAALARAPADLRPREEARHSVLVTHGVVNGRQRGEPLTGASLEGGAVIPRGMLLPERWTYIALGHHPVAEQIAPNMWYSGSIERTSADLWREARVEKGLVSFDTGTAEATFHPVPGREVVDLPQLSARGRSPGEVSAAIRALVADLPGRVADSIVHLSITDIGRAELREVERLVLRELRAAALQLVLDARAPGRTTGAAGALRVRGVTLDEQVEEYLGRLWEPTMEGIDNAHLVELARKYMAEAAEGSEGSEGSER